MAKRTTNYGVNPTMKWKRFPGVYGGTCGCMHKLEGTKFQVRHCGHPTALWPWYGLRPDGSMILAPNGRAFQFLQDAKAATEAEYKKGESRMKKRKSTPVSILSTCDKSI